MPRVIGASVGVKETVTGSPAALERPCSISGVWRCAAADAVGAHAAHDLGAEQVGLGGLARTGGSGGGDDDDVVAAPAGPRRSPGQGQQGGGRVAAGHGDALGALEGLALARAARAARRARCRRGRSRRTSPRRRRIPSRWSAPASITSVPSGSWAAISAEAPCGRARKTTSWPARFSTVVSTRTRSASPCRCGCSSPEALSRRCCGR